MKLYHVTKIKYIPQIFKAGLLVNHYIDRDYYAKLGILNVKPCIYVTLSKDKLTKPMSSRDGLLEITIPNSIWESMPRLYGDYVWHEYKDNEELLYKRMSDIFNVPIEEVKRRSTPFEWMSPNNTVLIYQDIHKKYIKRFK